MSIKSESQHAILEETDTAFDPTTMHLDLNNDEKRRTTALLLAIQAYNNLIIKDAEMYHAVKRDEKADDEGSIIRPATMGAMVKAAIEFDDFISGKLTQTAEKESDGLSK